MATVQNNVPTGPGGPWVTKQSAYSVDETLDRLEQAARAGGATIFARIDHRHAASAVGLTLRPTTVLIFGNPQAGTLLMQHEQRLGLELPLHVLGWEDESQRVWLSYRDLADLARAYGLAENDAHVTAIGVGLGKLTDRAIK